MKERIKKEVQIRNLVYVVILQLINVTKTTLSISYGLPPTAASSNKNHNRPLGLAELVIFSQNGNLSSNWLKGLQPEQIDIQLVREILQKTFPEHVYLAALLTNA